MRTSTEIESIIADTKINYSYRVVEVYEADKQRGIQKEDWSTLFAAKNILDTNILLLNAADKNLMCDFLIRNGFALNEDQLMFTEDVFTDTDFDSVN